MKPASDPVKKPVAANVKSREPEALPTIVAPSESQLREIAEGASPKPVAVPPKPKPQLIAVVCKLCQTRMYAKLSQAGGTMQCPDCHSTCEIPHPPSPKKPIGDKTPSSVSTSSSAPNSDTAAMLRDLVLASQLPPELQLASDSKSGAKSKSQTIDLELSAKQHAAETAAKAAAAVNQYADDDDLDSDDITLEAPVERIAITPEQVVRTSIADVRDTADEQVYDGDSWVKPAAPGQGTYYERSPLMIGVFEIIAQGEAFTRLLFHVVWGSVAIALVQLAVIYSFRGAEALLAILFVVFGSIIGCSFVLSITAQLQAIVDDTANGVDRIKHWPSPNFMEWMFESMGLVFIMAIAAAPGIAMGLMLYLGGASPQVIALIPVAVSLIFLLPPMLFSVLAEGRVFALVSPHLFRSFQTTGDGWMLFYMLSMVIAIGAAFFLALLELQTIYVAPVIAAGLLTLAFFYFRLIGRLLWMSARNDAATSAALSEKNRAESASGTSGSRETRHHPSALESVRGRS